MRSQSGTPSYSKGFTGSEGFTGAQFWPRAMRAAAKKLFFLLSILPPLLLWSSEACAQSTSPPATTPPEVQQNATPSTTNAVPEVPTPNVLPAPAPPRPVLLVPEPNVAIPQLVDIRFHRECRCVFNFGPNAFLKRF